MNVDRFLYRIRQFKLFLLASQPAPEDLEPARHMLTDRQFALFLGLQSAEQAHSLAVYTELVSRGESSPDLLTAALLHDIGKVLHPLKAWERGLVVIAKSVIPVQAHKWGSGPARGWRRPFVVIEQHPAWGAEMAAQVGTDAFVVELIRRHQEPLPQKNGQDQERTLEKSTLNAEILLRKLQAVDEDN